MVAISQFCLSFFFFLFNSRGCPSSIRRSCFCYTAGDPIIKITELDHKPTYLRFFFFTLFCRLFLRSTKEQPEMARTKQATPLRREVSDDYFSRREVATPRKRSSNGAAVGPEAKAKEAKVEKRDAGALELAIAVGGIYASL